MERRRYPRKPIKPQDGIRTTLVLSGRSLLHGASDNQIEIDARAVDISQGGVCVEVSFEAPWQSLLNHDEIDLVISKANFERPVKARVVHTRLRNKVLGVAFEAPIGDLSPFMMPRELYV